MKTLQRLTLFYITNLIIFLIVRVLSGGKFFYLILIPWIWLVPLFILLIGQVIGFFSFILVDKKEQKEKIFYNCALIASISFAIILLSSKLIAWNHQRNFGNIESNENFFEYYAGRNFHEKKIAFDTLIKRFHNPNDFYITGDFINGTDTIINGGRDTIYFLRILYKKNNDDRNYKADFTIFRSIADLKSFDIVLDEYEQYKIDSVSKKVIQNLKDAIKDAPDSFKKIVNDNFKDVLGQ